jgi:S1-C subfamily serine protease
MRIGDLTFKRLVCGFSQDEKGAGADATIAGLLGGRVLEQCTVIFDYDGERMILEPNERYGSSVEHGMSGLTIVTGGRDDWHKFTISHVMPDSPAASTGLKVNDVIVEIDGQPASEFFARDLAEMFRENGRKVTLKIRRDGETLDKTLKLKPMV